LNNITIYVDPPPFATKGNQININIMPHQLQLGLHHQGNATQWFLNEATHGIVKLKSHGVEKKPMVMVKIRSLPFTWPRHIRENCGMRHCKGIKIRQLQLLLV
jgi:hypothetical protein